MISIKSINKFGLLLMVGFVLSLLGPTYSYAATCNFTQDLELGVTNDEVLCLQQYLNGAGFKISESGAGSVGKETNEFKSLTQAAVVRWQTANGISPASGYFGPVSRAAYKRLVSGVGNNTNSNPSESASTGNVLLDSLMNQLKSLQDKAKANNSSSNTTINNSVNTNDEKGVRSLLKDILDTLDDAEGAIDDSNDNNGITEAEDNIDDAQSRLLTGLRYYLNGDYDKAVSILKRSLSSAKDAVEVAGGDETKQDAEDLIDEMDDRLDEVKDLIDEADDDGKATSRSEDLWDKADELLDEAKDMLDEEDYDEALDLAEEVDDLLNDAEDAIGKKGGGVDDDLADARDTLDEAWDDVDNALDDDKDVGEAEDLLDEAEGLLDDAEDALDDGDDSEAEDLIDEALDLIDEALDEF